MNAGKQVVVIGAGMAGLAAAHRLAQMGLRVTVLEKESRVGGRVRTERVEGLEVDFGARFVTNFYSHTLRLIREVNLQDELTSLPTTGAVLRGGQLYRLRPDWRLPFTELISIQSKLRLISALGTVLRHWRALDFHAFHKAYALDTHTIAEYARHKLSDEILEYVIQPPLAGFIYWTPERTSQAMLFVLLKASLGLRLFTLRHGLGTLPETLAARLEVYRNAEVEHVTPNESGGYLLQVSVEGRPQQLTADGIVCAVPALAVPHLFPDLNANQRAFFERINYSANTITALGLQRRLPPDTYGLLFPRREVKYLAAAAVESAYPSNGLPPNRDLVILYPSGRAGQELISQPDAFVRNTLAAELRRAGAAYDVGSDELFYRVHRWPAALPEFEVGHLARLKAFAEGQIESGPLVFAGDYLGGPFVEGAVSSGFQATKRLLERL